MCLHGLDILSMWMLFFSLLCATASAFQHSHLAKDAEVFVTNCMNNPRSCSARVDEMRVLQLFVFFVPTMFSGILGSFGKNSAVFKEGAFLGPARVLLQERERKGDDLKYTAVVWIVDGHQLVRYSSTHLRPVSTAEQTLCSLRDGVAQTFQQVVQELPKRNFVDLVGQPSPVEEDFEEPMNVASSDNELHEDFLSGEEFASAPDDSEVPKDPQMTYQTRSASSHAKTPAAMSPEPTEAPLIPQVEQGSSTARPSVTQPPTVPQSSTSQPSTIPPTASPSHMELSPEPMSQSRSIKRPLEQTPQPESKRMSLGEDLSVEHGILAAEDLRWLPKKRSREVRYPQTCWNPDATEKRGPVLASCAQDEVVEVAFALSHHEAIKIAETPATALAALARCV